MDNYKEKQTEKAIFFLRHNNDIDHITPVLYKWLSTEKIPTDVIITTKRSHLDDPRINYLKQFPHVKIFHINDLFKKYSIPHIFNRYYFSYDTNVDNWVKKSKFVKKKVDKTIKRISEKLFKDMVNGIVVFDWISIYFVRSMVDIAKKRGFTTISLPHGDRPYISIFETIDQLNYGALDAYEPLKMFDYVVVPNELNRIRFENYMEKERIKVLGSPRYSDEWMDIVSGFIPKYEVKGSENKLKIVFFLRNVGYPIFWDEVVRTIKLIMQFDEVYLIVKHHPRNRNAKRLTQQLIEKYPGIKRNLDKNLKFIYESVNSGSLLKWTDIVIDIGTSVTWESVKQSKPVFMLEYIHANYSTVAYYIKNTEIKCRDELYDKISAFIKNKNVIFYNETERRKFIKEIIDVPDKFVLERYVKFLKSCFKNKK